MSDVGDGHLMTVTMQLSFKFWFLHTTEGKFQCQTIDVSLYCTYRPPCFLFVDSEIIKLTLAFSNKTEPLNDHISELVLLLYFRYKINVQGYGLKF